MKVLLTEVRVEQYNDPNNDAIGQYSDFPRPNIMLNTAYSQHTQSRTLVHEYFHALYPQVMDRGEDTLTEEEAARLFELGVLDLVKNNWELLVSLKGD